MDYTLGEIILFAGTYTPEQFLPCDGRSLSVSQNQALYSVIGNVYGGDANNFNLPNLAGRIPVADGTGPGLTPRTIGQIGGQPTVTLTTAQMPSHTHSFTASTSLGTSRSINGLVPASTPDDFDPYIDSAMPTNPAQQLRADALTSTGGNQAHQNMMPTVGVGYYICVTGLFPN